MKISFGALVYPSNYFNSPQRQSSIASRMKRQTGEWMALTLMIDVANVDVNATYIINL